MMHVVAGLGNPGLAYRKSRHNAGFLALDALAERLHIRLTKRGMRGLYGEGIFRGGRVLLVKPQTYMNLSGESVSPAAAFYKVPPEHIIVVSDEVSLPIGKLRIRKSGSAGGHNGLKNIIAMLGTDAFPRIRMGVGAPPHADYDMADWVLSSFKNQDADDMRSLAVRVCDAVECYIAEGPDRAMNKFN